MPIIRCKVKKCLHYFYGNCNVTDDTIIDIDRKGMCDDMTEVTDDEYKLLTGCERAKGG